jgi:cytidine deaminase
MKKSLEVEYEDFVDYSELPELEQNLVEKAFSISQVAYAPYSNFKVGAAVLLKNGEVVLGSNQENIAYPSGLCAERVALFFAGANFPKETIKLIVIVAKGDLLPFDKILSPCGSCRQVMVESESRQTEPFQVILVSQNRRTIRFSTAKDLLPFAFGTI